MEVLNISLTCDFTNTAGYVICISPALQNCVSYTVKCVYEVSNRIIYCPIIVPYEIDDGNSVTLDMARSNKREYFPGPKS